MMTDTDQISKILREGVFLLGLLFLAYLLLSLFSYSAADPSFSSTQDNDEIHNWGGLFGAYAGALLLEFFGRSAYLFCFIFLLFWRVFVLRPMDEAKAGDANIIGWVWAAVGLLLCIVSSSSLEFLRFNYGEGLPAGAGGLVGKLVAENMQRLFGFVGAALILISIWLFSWSLVSGLSWFAFFERIGRAAEKALSFLFQEQTETATSPPVSPVRERLKAKKEKVKKEEPAERAEPTIVRKPSIFSPKKKNEPPVKSAPPAPLRAAAPASGGELGELPGVGLLDAAADEVTISDDLLRETAALIEKSLGDFNVSVEVVAYHPGPVITRYDMQPATGVKGAQIVNLSRDLARSLSVSSIRVLETIPGTNYVGLEIPNHQRSIVNLSEILSSSDYEKSKAHLPLALGKTAAGAAAIADIADMPHLLVAGSTGSGKSVFINALLLSLLFSRTPQALRLLLIDPKMLELASYADIPHLLAPVVTDMDLAPAALHWTVEEMERRYRLMATTGVRHITSYNKAVADGKAKDDEGQPLPSLPFIVVVIDELADLMMVAGKKVELSISRLAQKARAAGIHMVLATQRPSVDVITGLIKANVPCRLSFQVASKIDSRTILDQMGAEALLGRGDMLYMPSGAGIPQRLHGAFVSDDEAHRVVQHVKDNSGEMNYLTDFSDAQSAMAGGGGGDTAASGGSGGGGEKDPLYDEAVETVMQSQRASISLVQRKLRIGYNRAARIIESMEEAGLISAMDEMGARKVLVGKREG